jgi:uncharacterized paraquat-inducible protein A
MTREEAIKLIDNHTVCFYNEIDSPTLQALHMAIEALSAERPKGEWQKVDEQPYFRKHFDNVCCSVCHYKGMKKYNYCPNCGARMKGGEEE